MSNNQTSGNDHTFLGRKKKLSVWVRKIIQPTRDNAPSMASQSATSPTTPEQEAGTNSYYSDRPANDAASNSSAEAVREFSPQRTDSVSMKVLWGDEPKRLRQDTDSDVVPTRDDDSDSIDNVSIQALFSMCSSSFKSSTFSDVHSLQSTRATMVSGRTAETNSSTMAIPPASILDRTRHGSAAASTTTNLGSPTPSLHHSHHHHHHPLHISRPTSMRQMPIQRERERDSSNSHATYASNANAAIK